jgi:hypothetical protein
LETLILEACDISDDSCNILAEKLPFMKGLKELNLNHNPFYKSGARRLLDGLKANVNLFSLQSELYSHLDYENERHQMQRLLHVNRFRSGVRAGLMRMGPHLWPLILETADNDPDVMYFLLREEIMWRN